ncbi:hypothetical protein V8G54_013599 [Vigna mungo]|uniref:Uncharacterized protein n=1 Tax=Vigna mungo TaxID=3915 RepID=A0AAQ3NV03_VIGMU
MVRTVALIQRHRRQHRVSLCHGSTSCLFPMLSCYNCKEHLNALAISSDDESEQAYLQAQPQPHIIPCTATVIGLSSLNGCILTTRPNTKAAGLGFVGEVAKVDPAVLRSFIAPATSWSLPSSPPTSPGTSYNINADTVDGELLQCLAWRS